MYGIARQGEAHPHATMMPGFPRITKHGEIHKNTQSQSCVTAGLGSNRPL
jgi:hypothetical protein